MDSPKPSKPPVNPTRPVAKATKPPVAKAIPPVAAQPRTGEEESLPNTEFAIRTESTIRSAMRGKERVRKRSNAGPAFAVIGTIVTLSIVAVVGLAYVLNHPRRVTVAESSGSRKPIRARKDAKAKVSAKTDKESPERLARDPSNSPSLPASSSVTTLPQETPFPSVVPEVVIIPPTKPDPSTELPVTPTPVPVTVVPQPELPAADVDPVAQRILETLADLLAEKKLLAKKEYPRLRKVFADRAERNCLPQMRQGLGDSFEEMQTWFSEHEDIRKSYSWQSTPLTM